MKFLMYMFMVICIGYASIIAYTKHDLTLREWAHMYFPLIAAGIACGYLILT